MPRSQRYPALARFLDGYLHQDFGRTHGTAFEAARTFLRDASGTEVAAVASDWRAFLADHRKDSFAARARAIDAIGGSWRPTSEDGLRAVIEVFAAATDASLRRIAPMGTLTVPIPGGELRCTSVGEGPPVLLMPSLGRGAADFDLLAPEIADAGWRAIAVNPRAANGSTGTLDGLTLHDFAADLLSVLDAAGGGSAFVIGHAFGNRVARTLAADRPDRVLGVCLIACGGQIEPDEDVRTLFPRCLETGLPWEERREAIAACFFAPGSPPEVWREGWWPETARAERGAVQATTSAAWQEAGGKRLFIIQGLQDRLAVPENGRELQRRFGAHVTLTNLEGAGHALLPERPDAIAALVTGWLAAER